eukprot:6209502-Ditylum_brightwellii.AAC.1
MLRDKNEQNQKQAELLNTFQEDKRNECKDIFCFDCLDNLNPVKIRANEILQEQAQKRDSLGKGALSGKQKDSGANANDRCTP